MKKQELKTKLSLYTMASGALALMANTADAQVTYTDISPDGSITTLGGSYMIDLNGDLTNDFEFKLEDWGTATGALYIKPIAASGNGIVGVIDSGFAYKATSLPSGTTLTNTLTPSNVWGASAMMAVKGAGSNYGTFANATDKYIGLRLKSGADYYYGWVRVSVTIGTPSITIKDMAVSGVLNTSLSTGTTSIQNTEKLVSNTIIFVNDENEVSITNNNEKSLTADLVNLSGDIIATEEIENGASSLFNGSNLSSGLYLVMIKMEDTAAGVKVMIK